MQPGLASETYWLIKDCLVQEAAERIENLDQFLLRLDRAEAAEIALQARVGQESMVKRRLLTAVPFLIVLLSGLAFILFRGQALSLDDSLTPTPALLNEPVIVETQPSASPTRILPSPTSNANVLELTGASLEEPTVAPTTSPKQAATKVVLPVATVAVPLKPSTTPVPVCEQPETWVVYTVQEGEVLFNLALETGSTVDEVKQINCLTSNILSIGQEIWLPIFPPTSTPRPTLTSTPLPTKRPLRTTPTKTPPPIPTPASITPTP